MSVDKFGRFSHYSHNENRLRKTSGFNLDRDKNINLHLKRLKNLGSPIEDNDAVTKKFTTESINQSALELQKEITFLKDNINKDIKKDIEAINKYIEERFRGIEDYIFKQILEPKHLSNLEKTYLVKK